VAIAEANGGTYHQNGLDIQQTMKATMKREILKHTCYCKEGNCSLADCKLVDADKVLEQKVDIVVPAAIDNQINMHNMKRIKAKIILEMANNGITQEAEEFLQKNKVMIIPDVLANAGGVTVSYFEWKQNMEKKQWEKARILTQLEEMMKSSWDKVIALSKQHNASLREASYILALDRLL